MKTLSALLALSLLLTASPIPHSGSAYAAPQKSADNPGLANPGECPGLKCVETPVRKSLIQRLIQWVRVALQRGRVLAERLRQLRRDLAAYLKRVRGEVRDQTESSDCHDEACKSYGTKP
jgi:hypothetical protein